MPTVNTLVGKQQNTFRLVSEETSIRWRHPVGDVNDTDEQFYSGNVVVVTNASKSILRIANSSSFTERPCGIAFDTFTPTLDECTPNGGYGTYIVNHHIGQVSSAVSSGLDGSTVHPGQALMSTAQGKLTPHSGTNTKVAYLLRKLSNGWYEYFWVPPA